MVLVYFIGIIIVFFFIMLLSNLKIKIENVAIEKFKLDENYKIFVQIYFLNKIKLFSKKINVERFNNKKNIIQIKEKIKKNNIKIDKNILKEIIGIKPKIEMLNLKINLGYEEASINSYLVGILNGGISIILPYIASNSKNIKYKVIPVYNQNILDIYIDSIISIKIVHIIYVIFKIIRKGSKKNERTSNRRLNAYCNE